MGSLARIHIGHVRLSSQEIAGVAQAIIDDLARAEQLEAGSGHGPAIAAVERALNTYFAEEAALERDAAKMAAQHLQAAGRDALGLDRNKVTQMIMQRLAKERGFPL
ncbi:MAG: DUF507 family protein [Deltaproteobacteria bacterium]